MANPLPYGLYTVATLPPANSATPGTVLYTIDGGFRITNSTTWQTLTSATGVSFSTSVSDSPGTTVNNYAPSGYVGGVTNRLMITPNSGGTTITGLGAATDGWNILIFNNGVGDIITFTNQDGGSSAANQFVCQETGSVTLKQGAAVLACYVANSWVFV